MITGAAPSRESLVVVRDLSVTYRSSGDRPLCALSRASLEIRAGERIGVLGESGSGKSTLAASLLRLLPANGCFDQGAIQLLGRDLLSLDEDQLRHIRGVETALIPQDPALALNPVIRVGTQIAEVLRAHLRLGAVERRRRVEALLEEVGFAQPQEIYSAYPHQLSGGQRQRIVIAQAMACRPRLVVADEPTSKLDAVLQNEILSLMREISRKHGTAFVLISHDPAVLAGFAERILVMYSGQIVEEGLTADIFQRPLHPYTQALVRLSRRYLFADGCHDRFPSIDGEQSLVEAATVGCPFASRCPVQVPVCRERNPLAVVTQGEHRVSCFKYGE